MGSNGRFGVVRIPACRSCVAEMQELGTSSEIAADRPEPGVAIRPPRRSARPRGSRGRLPAPRPAPRALRRRAAKRMWARTVASACAIVHAGVAHRARDALDLVPQHRVHRLRLGPRVTHQYGGAPKPYRVGARGAGEAHRARRQADDPLRLGARGHRPVEELRRSPESVPARSLIAPRAVVRVSSRQRFAANDAPAGPSNLRRHNLSRMWQTPDGLLANSRARVRAATTRGFAGGARVAPEQPLSRGPRRRGAGGPSLRQTPKNLSCGWRGAYPVCHCDP